MNEKIITHYLGIDVGKCDLYCHLSHGISARFDNNTKGICKLQRWIERVVRPEQVACCLEQTGCYSREVAHALHASGAGAVYVVNPCRIKAFGQQRLRRNKTDKADAQLICRFVEQEHEQLRRWSPLAPEQEAILELYRYVESLIGQRTQCQNRLGAAHSKIVAKSLRKMIRTLEGEIKSLRSEIDEIISGEPQLKEAYTLLLSIPGVSQITAQAILAEVPRIDEFESGRQLAAWAGLTPRHFQSGTSGRTRTPISKVGSARIRKALYLPAMSAMRYNPQLRSFAQRLKANGKNGKEIVIAVARKLLELAYAILKSGQPFDPEHMNPNIRIT